MFIKYAFLIHRNVNVFLREIENKNGSQCVGFHWYYSDFRVSLAIVLVLYVRSFVGIRSTQPTGTQIFVFNRTHVIFIIYHKIHQSSYTFIGVVG